jgi:hypothetical protein
MATTIGEIGLDLVVNHNQFKSQMAGITGLAKKAGATLAAAFGVKKLIDFSKSCIELGSDLAEVQNVVDVTFPSMAEQVDKFAKSAAGSFGLSETMAKKYTGTFGAMAKAFGFSEKQALDMGATLTGLAGDVASFYNLSQDEAYTKIKSVFTGETESLKDLGVVMTQTALDSYALANGFGKTTDQMSEAEKVALRYSFVQKQLEAATGDFSRTSESWANQVRILSLQFQSLKASIGQGLINIFRLVTLADAFKSFTELITGNKSSGQSGVGAVGADAASAAAGLTDASSAADQLADSTSGVGDAAKQAAKDMKSLMEFDKINKVSKDSSTSDSQNSSVPNNVAGSIDFGSLASGETVIDDVNKKFADLFGNITKLSEPALRSVKRLWNEGLARLGNFSSQSLKDFYQHFLVPVGKWTLGTGIPRFVDALNDGLMKTDFPKINGALNDLWDALAPFTINVGEGLLWFWEQVLVPLGTWTANEIVPRFLETLSLAIQLLNAVLVALQPLFEWFWENVLQPIAQWTGGAFLTLWDGINKGLQVFSDWCAKNPGIIQSMTVAIGMFFGAWKVIELLSFIQQAGGVVGALKLIETALLGAKLAKIKDAAETAILTGMYAKDFVVGIGQSIVAIGKQALAWITNTAAQIAMTAATVAWNAICAIATAATTAFGAAVAFLTSPIGLACLAIAALVAGGVLLWKNWDTVKEKCGQLHDWIVSKFSALKDWMKSKFETDWTERFGVLGNVLNWFCDIASGKIETVKNIFQGLTSFLKNIFAGKFSDALKIPVNGLIGMLNRMLTAIEKTVNCVKCFLNKLNVKIPSWVPGVGGKKLGFQIPTASIARIPYLADGGYVARNTPRLAVIGDNKRYGEIVAPEDKLQKMVDLAVSKASGGSVTKAELESIVNSAVLRIVAALSALGFSIDGETLAKAQQKVQQEMDRRYNTVQIN